ncbi:hypothetical protein K2Z83_00720 [Oscillochloris sp. ZM17-4]|uniref:two-component regulator propeller domain-containing protein n=1 Tax=Oscillochloris sp. ZM17-4 TaxID=2866714 RepID=UPI001C73A173|nr:two-component regulator propeller domain-containing protein [Oscillochloris sp. ZM17-4]MBX0326215.1 hypothetical protein [Oscillochloris sp. ZM17-4]
MPRRFLMLTALLILLVALVGAPPARAGGDLRWHTFSAANGLAGNIVQAIWEDPAGRIWLGSENGVSRYDGASWVSYGVADGLADDNVWSIAGDGESVWCATSRGLSRLRGGRWERFGVADGLPGEDVRAVLVTADGAVWAGTFGRGIARLAPGARRWEPAPLPPQLARIGAFVQAIWQAPGGDLWFATNGLGALRLRDGRFEQFSFRLGSRNTVWSITALPGDDAVWMGTFQGVARIAPDDTVTVLEDLVQGRTISATETLAVAGDADGDLWLATRSQGVLRRTMGGWQRVGAADGLGRNYVQTILADREGRIWFGTRGGGVTLADRRPLSPDLLVPTLAAMAVSDDLPLAFAGGTLPATQNDLRFRFGAAVPWLPPDELRFRYWLGRAGEQPPLAPREVGSGALAPGSVDSEPFIDLPPGDYTLHVVVVAGAVAGPERTLAFRIASAPPAFAQAAPTVVADGAAVSAGLTLPQHMFERLRRIELRLDAQDDSTPPEAIRYEYRVLPAQDWRAAAAGRVLIDLPVGAWVIEARAVDAEGNASAPTQLRVVVPAPLWTTLLLALAVLLVPSAASAVGGALLYRRRQRRQALLRAVRGYHIPYDVGPLITLPDRYIGREHVIDTVVGKIEQNSFYIYGEKRIGKTSLLLQVQQRLILRADLEPGRPILAIFRNIQDVPQEQFWLHLLRGVAAALPAAARPPLLCLGQPASYDDLDAEQDLEQIVAHGRGGGAPPLIVLLLDEIDTLQRYDLPLRQRFRALCQHAQGQLRVVLAGVRPPLAEPGDTSPWYNIFERVTLGPLLDTDALHLIRHYNYNPYAYTRAAAQAVLAAGERKPFDTQWLCSEAVRAMLSDRRTTVTEGDVARAVEVIVAARAGEYTAAWRQLAPATRAALRAGAADLDAVAAEQLLSDGLIAEGADGYRPVFLWGRWISTIT